MNSVVRKHGVGLPPKTMRNSSILNKQFRWTKLWWQDRWIFFEKKKKDRGEGGAWKILREIGNGLCNELKWCKEKQNEQKCHGWLSPSCKSFSWVFSRGIWKHQLWWIKLKRLTEWGTAVKGIVVDWTECMLVGEKAGWIFSVDESKEWRTVLERKQEYCTTLDVMVRYTVIAFGVIRHSRFSSVLSGENFDWMASISFAPRSLEDCGRDFEIGTPTPRP